MKQTPLKRSQGLSRYKRPSKTVKAIFNKEREGVKLQRPELIKACDKVWAQLIKLNAKGLCEWCGKPAQDAHHMVSRRHAATRHDPLNGVALCKGCHLHFHNHESLTGWEKFRESRPLSWAAIDSARYATFKATTEGLRTTLEALRAQVKEFGE